MNTHRIAFADAGSAWTRFGAHGSGQGQFARPAGAAFLQSGQLVVLDSGNCRVVALDDIGGAGWTAYGHRGRPTPGDPAVGAFADPRGLAVDTADRIWVSDPGAQRVVRMDAPDGTGWTEVGLPAGSGAALPYGIGAYGDGVALIDAANYRLLVLDDAGSTAATVDLADGTWVSPAFVCGSGNGLVVADVVANELRLLEPDEVPVHRHPPSGEARRPASIPCSIPWEASARELAADPHLQHADAVGAHGDGLSRRRSRPSTPRRCEPS